MCEHGQLLIFALAINRSRGDTSIRLTIRIARRAEWRRLLDPAFENAIVRRVALEFNAAAVRSLAVALVSSRLASGAVMNTRGGAFLDEVS